MSWDSDRLETLKVMDQWVCWGFYCGNREECGIPLGPDADECPECGGRRTKPPVAPFDGRRYAKSNTPRTWRSYEEAVEYHEREDTHTEGIGFMLSEQDLIVGIDLDGCVHPETKEIEPWAEDIVARADSYTEISPSVTGLHIFAVGILPDGRKKRKQERTLDLPEWVVEEKNAEVEMYDDVRYMTYTGNQLPGTPDDAQKRASAVKEIHAEYVADGDADASPPAQAASPDSVDVSADGGTEYTNEFGTTLERVREWDGKLNDLLTHLEPGFSLPNDDDSPSGYDYSAVTKLLFWRFDERDIANILRRYRSRDKLDRDDYLQRTIANAQRDVTDRCDPPQDRSPSKMDAPSEVKVALEGMLSLYENDPDREMQHRGKIWECVAKIDADDVENFAPRVADVLDVQEYAVQNHRTLARHEEENGPVVVEDGKTWLLHGTPRQKYELLNFELEVLSYLQVERGPLRAELKATLESGETFEKPIEPKVFNRKDRFDDEILGERFGTKFNIPQLGDRTPFVKDLLDALRMWVDQQDAPHRLGVRHMGLHGDEFALPGRTLRADGWAEEPETVYLEREITPERLVEMPSDTAEYDSSSVAEILETVPFTRDAERLLPVLGWFYAAPFRPLIEKFTESGEFNHLNVTGDTGSGKTTTLSYLWRCFGMAGEPFSVDSSNFAQVATFSCTNSLPLWFDEYKPSDISSYRLDFFHNLYRKATRGALEVRGNADKTTDEYKIEAPVVVSGEQSIQGPAERRRSVMTQFRTETTDAGTETAEAYKNLVGKARVDGGELELGSDAPDPAEHALAYYRFVTGFDENRLRRLWYDSLEHAHARADALGVVDELDDLEMQGLQTVVFGFTLYHEFAEHVGADTESLPTEEDLNDALEYVVERIGPAGKRKSHTDRFIELFERAVVAGYLEQGQHYEIVHECTPREQVRINLPRSFDAISKYAKDHDIRSEDLLNAHSDYRDRFRELAEQPGSFVKCTDQYTAGVSQCTGISTLGAMNDLEGFDRASLGVGPIEGDEEVVALVTTDDESDTEGNGDEYEQTTVRVKRALQDDPLTMSELCEQTGCEEKPVRDALSTIQGETYLDVRKAESDGETRYYIP